LQVQVPLQVQQPAMQPRTHWQQTPQRVEYERAQVFHPLLYPKFN
jgi:hypothetical protein